MKINILSIGNQMPKWVSQGFQEYHKRFDNSCQVMLVELPMAKRSKNGNAPQYIAAEGKTILPHLQQPNTHHIALTVTGKSITTEQLASDLQDWLFSGKTINLLIGGPDGLAPGCVSQCHEQWSLSALTLPHPLVRLVVIEQLYRAWTLLKGHPYHRA